MAYGTGAIVAMKKIKNFFSIVELTNEKLVSIKSEEGTEALAL